MKPTPVRTEVNQEELEPVLARVWETLREKDYANLKAVIETLANLTDSLKYQEIGLERL